MEKRTFDEIWTIFKQFVKIKVNFQLWNNYVGTQFIMK